MKNPKKELFQENSMTFQGLLSNLPIFQDAFPGLKPILGLCQSTDYRTSGNPEILKR